MSAALKDVFKPVHHARLLTDDKGPYGIEVDTDEGQTEAVVIRLSKQHTASLILPTLFHAIPKGKASWARGHELHLAHALHHAMLKDRGFPFGEKKNPNADDWKLYHGLRCLATRVINSLLNELYAEIPVDLLRVVRRYPLRFRSDLYEPLSVDGTRAWQLADTFPVLAGQIYISNNEHTESRELVKRGARLRDIAALEGISMGFRQFKPAVLRHLANVCPFLKQYPNVVNHHCPTTVPKQRAWLQAIEQAENDPDYAVWVAKNFGRIGHWRAVPAIVGDVRDWVRSTCHARAVEGIEPETVQRLLAGLRMTGDRHAASMLQAWDENCRENRAEGRPFDSRMAPQTVLRLSREWHDRQAERIADNVAFPAPWYDGGEIGSYSIVPLATAADLSHYGRVLHNCASSYAGRISHGECFLYAVNQGDKPVAMFELVRDYDDKTRLVQLKGPCNQAVSKPVSKSVNTWLRRQRKAHGSGRKKIVAVKRGVVDDCDDLPF